MHQSKRSITKCSIWSKEVEEGRTSRMVPKNLSIYVHLTRRSCDQWRKFLINLKWS